MPNIFVTLVAVYLFFSVIDSLTENLTGVGEVTVYRKYCLNSGKSEDIFKCKENGGLTTRNKEVFRVDFPNQRVISAANGYVSSGEKCKVFNSKNWSCESTYMRDGDYGTIYDSKTENGKFTITRINELAIEYWYHFVKSLFGES